MKIMQILPKMNVGGVERGVLDFAKYFQNREDSLIVVSGGGRLVEKLESFGVKHYTLNVFKKSPLTLFSILKLRKIIKKEKIDIVHARSRVPGWIAFFASRGLNVDFITTAHGAYSVHRLSQVMAWGKCVICPSNTIARYMQENFKVDRDRIVVVNRWVDLDNFQFSNYQQNTDKPEIITVGRISASKGYEYLIKAMAKVVRVNPYIVLNIVGSYDKSKEKYYQQLNNLVKANSLQYNVNFLGFRSDIGDLLSRSQLLVFPSIVEESFGRAVIEAFSCGVPVVASKVGAVSEIIDDRKNGLLVPAKDPDALADAILELLNNPGLAEKFSEKGRQKVESFYSLNACGKKVEDIYHKIKLSKRILVIKLSSLGDIVLIVPALKALKEKFKESKVSLLTLKKYAPLLHNCPYIDDIIAVDSGYKNFKNILDLSAMLRRKAYDYVVDFQNNRASHLISYFSFPRKSFGYNRKLGRLLTKSAAYNKEKINPIESQQKVLDMLQVKIDDKKLQLWPVDDYIVDNLGLKILDNLIGINVSASERWQTKNWPKENLFKFIDIFLKEFKECKIVLLGDESCVKKAKEIEARCKNRCINLAGKTTLQDLAAVLSLLKVFICQDTATLHMASAVDVPTVALFGPTDPKRHVVESNNLHVIYKEFDCSFCYKSKCESCECMKKITPQQVLAIVRDILKADSV